MRIYLTTCCKEKTKTESPIPAIDLYLDPRIHFIHEQAQKDEVEFRILSGKWGVIHPNQELDWYDKKLELEDIEEMTGTLLIQLATEKITEIIFFVISPKIDEGTQPYIDLMKKATAVSGISLSVWRLGEE